VRSATVATPISLEFFPPKTPEGADKLTAVRQQLYALKPEFCSVTFGAGGSTQDGTLQTVMQVMDEGVPAAPHLSCIGQSRDSIRERLNAYRLAGIKRLVALRGDLPSGYGSGGEFRYASDLVSFVRAETGQHFHIEVAAYPEIHPQAKSPQADLLAFKTKIEAGANSGMTQYFFNADAYLRYRDDLAALGVQVPIAPGIMPITSSSQLMRFSDACGAEIPRWIRQRLTAYGDDVESIKAFGLDVVTDLCERLLAQGVPSLHFYTMNQAHAVLTLVKRLNLA
jgi:methylenetetrahydrofolate reductase (NADPH)